MDALHIPTITDAIALSHEDAVALYEALVPIVALLRARIVAQGELARPAPERRADAERERTIDRVAETHNEKAVRHEIVDAELEVLRVNRSGRVVFVTPYGEAASVPTNTTRDRWRRMKPGQRVRIKHAEYATLPGSGGRAVLRAVELR